MDSEVGKAAKLALVPVGDSTEDVAVPLVT